MKAMCFAAILGICGGASLAQSATEVLVAQKKLNSLGFDVGEPDGRLGPATRRGLKDAATKFGFKPTIDDLYKHFAIVTIQGVVEVTDEDIIQSIRDSMNDKLKDPFSAQYKDIRRLPSRRICGYVNAKNSYGAYAGWTEFITVTPPLKIGDKYSTLVFLGDGGGFVEAMCLIDAG